MLVIGTDQRITSGPAATIITPRPECLRVRDSGGNSARANEADPGDALQLLARLIGAVLHNEPLLDRANHRLQCLELSCQYDQARTRINGQTGILFVRNDRQQLLDSFDHFVSALLKQRRHIDV